MKLYNCGVPKLAGNHSSGTPFGIVKLAVTNVDPFVLAGIGESASRFEVTFSSGISTVSVGASDAMTERTARVTMTTQSASWFARTMDVWPALEISSELSSMNTLPVDASKGCAAGVVTFAVAGVSVTKYAGLKMPLGTNAGPCNRYQWGRNSSLRMGVPSPSRSRTESCGSIAGHQDTRTANMKLASPT